MSEVKPTESWNLPPSLVRHLNALCNRFEAAWKAGQHPRIEDHLGQMPELEQSVALRELLALELVYRVKAGERPALDDYLARFPANRQTVREIFQQEFPAAEQPLGKGEAPPSASSENGGESDPPVCLGRYRILDRLGSGGFGVVYKAFDEELARVVAIKIPSRQWTTSPEHAAAYRAEARLLARLDHPGIVPIYDVGLTEQGTCYLVSKFIDGCDLRTRLQVARPSFREAAEIVAQVAEALAHAHQAGLVHRDIKPANILLDQTGRAVVADFGLALRREEYGTGPSYAGTPAYMSPEQARGEGHRVDARSDVYSLGVVLFELLTGQRPYRDENRAALLEQIKVGEPIPPRQVDPQVPKELDRICLKALANRARERYSTALDFAEDLRHWLAGEPERPAVNVHVMMPPADAGGSARTPTHSGPHERAPQSSPAAHRTPEPDTPSVQVIPKGLRSFDAEDADFFLDLLPGPRDRHGLPETIRFWKRRVEATDADQAFSVGILYGPSGCGKSSLVKAGLLPRLAGHVVAVYVEATPEDTEARLLKGIRKRVPGLPDGLTLPETLAHLRRGHGLPAGKKVLIVLDQFEQWLHSRRQENAALVEALRQCDGQRVQCLVLVRDDFGMAVARFMQDLEVPIVEGQNFATVDLFDLRHTRKVLAKFGRAFGCLSEQPDMLTPEQDKFLEDAAAGLARDGKVVPVRLALFMEMVKTRPWDPATLKQVGGTEGLGIAFLEETFGHRAGNPTRQLHHRAVRSVLKALLPEAGTDLKGHMRSRQELLAASGYQNQPRAFDELLHILDADLRLVTPTDPEGKDEGGRMKDENEDSSFILHPSSLRCYQLTHDYLVPALRQWLTRKQRETRRGRAELRLEERAAFWSQRPESRHLPSLWEWAQIRALTRPSDWSPAQRQMMRRAGWFYASRMAILFIFVGFVGLVTFLGLREQAGSLTAAGLVDQLAAAEIREVPRIVGELDPYRRWATPLLKQMLQDYPGDAKRQLHARLALLPGDADQVPLVLEQLLVADPEEVGVIRKELATHRQTVIAQLWPVLENAQADSAKRLRAASALAACDPESAHWPRVAPGLAEILVKASPLQVGKWVDQMNPIRMVLLPPLAAIGRDIKRPDAERDLAVNLVSRYGAGQPAVLAEFIRDIEPRYGAMATPALQQAHDGQTIAWLVQQLEKRPGPDVPPAARERRLQQQANTAAMLVLLGQPDRVWPLLRHRPDPSLRTYLIHTLGPLGIGLPSLARRLEQEQDISVQQALIQCLGETAVEKSPPDERKALVDRLKQRYRDDPDPGIHSSIDWLLRRWGYASELARMDREQALKRGRGRRRWYINGQGHTMAIIPSPGRFTIGSPKNDPDRLLPQEAPKVQPIVYSYAIATKEVTVRQFQEFLHDCPNIMSASNRAVFERFNQDPTHPVRAVTWFEAAEYCRWLSDKEGVAQDQMCYPSVQDIDRAVRDPGSERGIKLAPTALGRTGYRLPTEAEWEYACRAQAATSRFFGPSEEMLGQYGWYGSNSGSHPHPVGRLKPNDFGLFDMYGNVSEWTNSDWTPREISVEMRYLGFLASGATIVGLGGPPQGPGNLLLASPAVLSSPEHVLFNNAQLLHRGGTFANSPAYLRSAMRFLESMVKRDTAVGFRVARTER